MLYETNRLNVWFTTINDDVIFSRHGVLMITGKIRTTLQQNIWLEGVCINEKYNPHSQAPI
ncbi:MAG: hypothetical protein IT212_13505 [Bacteroidia bacterium]|nr:hypothetical protein [Bacteroidia bacterium]